MGTEVRRPIGTTEQQPSEKIRFKKYDKRRFYCTLTPLDS
jgi:hypothetical protein